MTIRLVPSGPEPLWFDVAPVLALGAANIRWKGIAEASDGLSTSGTGNHAKMGGNVPVTFMFEYEGGVDIVPPINGPEPGDRTSALKVLTVRETGTHEITITVAGVGGRTYFLPLQMATSRNQQVGPGFTTVKASTDTPDVKIAGGLDGVKLEIPFQGNGYVTREIRVRW
jgi:hypothetical protein